MNEEVSLTALAFYKYASFYGYDRLDYKKPRPEVTMSYEKYRQAFEALPPTWRWMDGHRDDLHFMLKGVIFRPV